MWPYWVLFLLPSIAALHTEHAPYLRPKRPSRRLTVAWVASGVALTLMIGYRFEVGADWPSYLQYVLDAQGTPLGELLTAGDPGYQLLNWISVNLDWGVFGVNLLGGAIFAIGLVRFCLNQPRPWLALAVAVPYLVIVVAMGYSRQGIALGCAMIGLVSLARKSTIWFVLWVLIGATFHKTALLLLPIAGLAGSKNRWWTVVWVAAVTVGAYFLLLRDSVETLYANYVEAEYESQGALIRLLMNALPAALLLSRSSRFGLTSNELRLWRWFSAISLALLAAFFLTHASTALDRVALYMLPLQIVVFSRTPTAFSTHQGGVNRGWVGAVLSYYGAVLLVWLVFATHSQYWIPYRFYPLDGWL